MHLTDLLQPVDALRRLTATTPEIYDAARDQLDQLEATIAGLHERLQAHEARRCRSRRIQPQHTIHA